MREVRLEILRQGPAHNQLLSPLTQYLVLCGNRPATTLQVDFEHHDFLVHLSALRYEQMNENQRYHIAQMRELMGRIVADLGDLKTEVSAAGGNWLNLRLVISPAELSVLPFEMAKSPDSFPGADLPLLLNPHRPIVLTREIRQAGSRAFTWPETPRILVAAAALPGSSVPLKKHLLALRRALDPWASPSAKLSDWCTIIEHASLADIADACNAESFTHVHILAHGAPLPGGGRAGYGFVLHDADSNGADIVNGRRLAEALCRPRRDGGGHDRPAVVVLASCDSGARQDVWYTGASMAHVLHGAGIPLVVASQYPLSKKGLIILTETLYRRLLLGEDPRQALYFARRELKTRVPKAHDYASLVAYAALPENVTSQLVNVRLRRILALLKVSREWNNELQSIDSQSNTVAQDNVRQIATEVEKRLDRATALLVEELQELENAEAPDWEAVVEACGLLGSVHMRRAEHQFHLDKPNDTWIRSLATARDWYEKGTAPSPCAKLKQISHWTAVQYLSLSAVLNGTLEGMDDIWRRARASAEADAHDPTHKDERIWARGSLVELWMLRPLITPDVTAYWENGTTMATDLLRDFQKYALSDSYFVLSVRNQLKRYTEWWGQINKDSPDFQAVVKIAEDLLSRLEPATSKP